MRGRSTEVFRRGEEDATEEASRGLQLPVLEYPPR